MCASITQQSPLLSLQFGKEVAHFRPHLIANSARIVARDIEYRTENDRPAMHGATLSRRDRRCTVRGQTPRRVLRLDTAARSAPKSSGHARRPVQLAVAASPSASARQRAEAGAAPPDVNISLIALPAAMALLTSHCPEADGTSAIPQMTAAAPARDDASQRSAASAHSQIVSSSRPQSRRADTHRTQHVGELLHPFATGTDATVETVAGNSNGGLLDAPSVSRPARRARYETVSNAADDKPDRFPDAAQSIAVPMARNAVTGSRRVAYDATVFASADVAPAPRRSASGKPMASHRRAAPATPARRHRADRSIPARNKADRREQQHKPPDSQAQGEGSNLGLMRPGEHQPLQRQLTSRTDTD